MSAGVFLALFEGGYSFNGIGSYKPMATQVSMRKGIETEEKEIVGFDV